MLYGLLILACAILALYTLSWVRCECRRVDNALRRLKRRIRRPAPAAPPLVFDAVQGFYRPAK